jgi:hypothetical protein
VVSPTKDIKAASKKTPILVFIDYLSDVNHRRYHRLG